ncbi:hypothetical protein VULLAG_LOCUS19383 [Vulpes lagopus]
MHAGGGDRTGGALRPPGKESRAPARSCHHIQQPSPSAGDETSEKQPLFSVKVHFLLLAPPSGLHAHAHPKVNANTAKFSGESLKEICSCWSPFPKPLPWKLPLHARFRIKSRY